MIHNRCICGFEYCLQDRFEQSVFPSCNENQEEVVDSNMIEGSGRQAVLNMFASNLHEQAPLPKIITVQFAGILQDHTLEHLGESRLKD